MARLCWPGLWRPWIVVFMELFVGKIRLAASARRNHWWNVPFRLTGRGITTRPMGQVDGNPIFTIDFDFVERLY